ACGEKFALILLTKNLVAERDALLREELRRDARALISRDLGPPPRRRRRGRLRYIMPLVIEEAGLAVGRGHEPERATGDGEHGIEGVIQRIGDESGFIDDQESDAGESTDVGGNTGESDD